MNSKGMNIACKIILVHKFTKMVNYESCNYKSIGSDDNKYPDN
jgi:hypothetical protein